MRDRIDHARGWLRKGDSDRETVELLIAANGPFDTACFHAQQAAEKSLKGYVAYLEQPIPRTHNLEELQRICASLSPEWSFSDAELSELTSFAIELRYDFEFWPDRETTERALKLVARVREAVCEALPEKAIPR